MAKTARLPKPPIRPKKPKFTGNPPEIQKLVNDLGTKSRMSRDECNYSTSGTWESPTVKCGKKPVVADWFRGEQRISSLCERHDAHAQSFANLMTDHRRVSR